MPDTFTKISTATVPSGGSATISFTSIPQTYTDLQLVISGRKRTTGLTDLTVQMNSVTPGYNFRSFGGNGTAVSSTVFTNMTYYYAEDAIAGTDATANAFGSTIIYIPNYTSTSYTKTFNTDSTTENNSTTAYVRLSAGSATTAAITNLTLALGSGNFAEFTTATLYGIASAAAGVKATGGIISSDSSYIYHTFKASGTFTPTQTLSCDVLVVAGGAGGGAAGGGSGGGGAGGLLAYTSQSIAASAQTITVGAGGAGALYNTQRFGYAGSNSQFASLTASVGGGGGGGWQGGSGVNGGSGGGSCANSALSTGSPGTGTSGQGNSGGTGTTGSGNASWLAGGGGGGAVSAGSNGTGSGTSGGTPYVGGAGGAGSSTYSSWLAVTNVGQNVSGTYYIAGGGAGAAANNGVVSWGTAGNGGGGGGSSALADGLVNTGGGGAGDKSNPTTNPLGGSGGSGVVIIRYAR